MAKFILVAGLGDLGFEFGFLSELIVVEVLQILVKDKTRVFKRRVRKFIH